jgi:hypothetical protein
MCNSGRNCRSSSPHSHPAPTAVNAISTHTAGRPLGAASMQVFHHAMNSDANLRIKSTRGNAVLDERRDARVAAAYENGSAIEGISTATRAYQAYSRATNMGAPLAATASALGGMAVMNPDTGRTHLLRNHGNF